MVYIVTFTVLPYMDTEIIRQKKKSKQIFNNNVVMLQGYIVKIL